MGDTGIPMGGEVYWIRLLGICLGRGVEWGVGCAATASRRAKTGVPLRGSFIQGGVRNYQTGVPPSDFGGGWRLDKGVAGRGETFEETVEQERLEDKLR